MTGCSSTSKSGGSSTFRPPPFPRPVICVVAVVSFFCKNNAEVEIPCFVLADVLDITLEYREVSKRDACTQSVTTH
jgi:hypothetical protein